MVRLTRVQSTGLVRTVLTPDDVEMPAPSTSPPSWRRSSSSGNRTHGEFTRHSHPETDEVFLVLSGSLTVRMDDGDVTLGPAS
jgi:mannose-6-phosphate isomerase-like protein (cupin superfamily)